MSLRVMPSRRWLKFPNVIRTDLGHIVTTPTPTTTASPASTTSSVRLRMPSPITGTSCPRPQTDSFAAAHHNPLPGPKRLHHESADMAAHGDRALIPCAQELRPARCIDIRRATPAARCSLARNHYLWLGPLRQPGRVGSTAAVMRAHQDLAVHRLQSEHAAHAFAFQVAGEEDRVPCVTHRQDQAAGVFVAGN